MFSSHRNAEARKAKARQFTEHIRALLTEAGQKVPNRKEKGHQKSQYDLIAEAVEATEELLEHNEWGVGIENLLSNLYEVNFRLSDPSIELAYETIKACGLNVEGWKVLEELKK